MLKNGMYIIILCLFVVTTVAAPAYASCQCDMAKNGDMPTTNPPCHQSSLSDEAKSNNADDGGKCCGDSCACASVCISASIDLPSVTNFTKILQNKYSPPPITSLSSIIIAVPGSPPKQLS
jgi:hypothetical protein